MEIEILTVPDCPHAGHAVARVQEAARLAGVHPRITHHVVSDEATAEARGMRGSPTILVDGADIDPAPAEVGRLSCVASPDGGVPSAERLAQMLGRGTAVS